MQAINDSSFALHPQLAADTVVIGDWPLSLVLLMNDANYPWLILVPRRNEIREIYQLAESDQIQFLRESSALGEALMKEFSADKLNVAALGNMVPQLHIHHIVRFAADIAWPKPVWGAHPAQPYPQEELDKRVVQLRKLLNTLF
jgi:diadenosine tetraphosphate (Ap4A) HIT family hydrolase